MPVPHKRNVGGMPQYVIAASNTSPYLKDSAQFCCTGTNDAALINSVLSDLSNAGGGTVYLLPGTYNLTGPVVVGSNIKLLGSGEGSTLLKVASGVTTTLDSLINVQGSDVSISFLALSGNLNGQIYATHGIKAYKDATTAIKNLKVSDVKIEYVNIGIKGDLQAGNEGFAVNNVNLSFIGQADVHLPPNSIAVLNKRGTSSNGLLEIKNADVKFSGEIYSRGFRGVVIKLQVIDDLNNAHPMPTPDGNLMVGDLVEVYNSYLRTYGYWMKVGGLTEYQLIAQSSD